MFPELHGYEHIDYGKLSKEKVQEHLSKGIDWMEENLDIRPKKWYTPWGANAPHLLEAAAELNLQLVDCSDFTDLPKILRHITKTGDLDFYRGKEILIHWWERGNRLRRLAGIYKFGSIERAKIEDDPAVWGK